MKMWRIVVVKQHCNNNSVKTGYFRHKQKFIGYYPTKVKHFFDMDKNNTPPAEIAGGAVHWFILTPQPPLPRARGSTAPLSFRRGAGGEDSYLAILNVTVDSPLYAPLPWMVSFCFLILLLYFIS
jgi:hypothetical protein